MKLGRLGIPLEIALYTEGESIQQVFSAGKKEQGGAEGWHGSSGAVLGPAVMVSPCLGTFTLCIPLFGHQNVARQKVPGEQGRLKSEHTLKKG